MAIQRFLRRFDDLWMIGESKVVVGTEIYNFGSIFQRNHGFLRAGDYSLIFVEPRLFDVV